MAIGRLGKKNFLQDQAYDKAFFIPGGESNRRFRSNEVVEVSSEYPTILGVFGSENYRVFSSKSLSRVNPKGGVLSRSQLRYLQDRTSELSGLSIGQTNITTIVYPDKNVNDLQLSDLILVRAQKFMPFFGDPLFDFRSGVMADGIFLTFNTDCDYSYLRDEVLDQPLNPDSNLSLDHYLKLQKLYPQRVEQTGSNLEDSLVDWMNGRERLT